MSPTPPRSLRILFVEDDPDIRETLADFLRDDGHDVTEAGSAEEALAALSEARFHLVLSDYNLPGQDGVAMIREADRCGWLAGAKPMLLTASARVEGADDIRTLRKPIDMDDLAREIAAIPVTPAVRPTDVEAPSLALLLFVHGASPATARSVQTVQHILHSYGLPDAVLRVVDVATDEGVALAEQEHVAFTPALMRKSPPPVRWVVGELRKSSVVDRMLRDVGVRRP